MLLLLPKYNCIKVNRSCDCANAAAARAVARPQARVRTGVRVHVVVVVSNHIHFNIASFVYMCVQGVAREIKHWSVYRAVSAGGVATGELAQHLRFVHPILKHHRGHLCVRRKQKQKRK